MVSTRFLINVTRWRIGHTLSAQCSVIKVKRRARAAAGSTQTRARKKTPFFAGRLQIEPIVGHGEHLPETIAINKCLGRLKATKNAIFAWEALSLCTKHNVEIPTVLLKFVRHVAERLAVMAAEPVKGTNHVNAEIRKAVLGTYENPIGSRGAFRDHFNFMQNKAIYDRVDCDFQNAEDEHRLLTGKAAYKRAGIQHHLGSDAVRNKYLDRKQVGEKENKEKYDLKRITPQDVADAWSTVLPPMILTGTLINEDAEFPPTAKPNSKKPKRKISLK